MFGEKLDQIMELTNETNFDDLIYHFKDDSSRKGVNDFENGIKSFLKQKDFLIW